jgi:GT2 family glycosyltransferase
MRTESRLDGLTTIIVCYNNEKTIRQALGSIKRTDGIKSETIVVDNDSKDSTLDAVRDSIHNRKDVTLIRNIRNLGFAKANNLAIKKAKGEFILLMNPDIVLGKETVAALLDFMKKNKRVGAVGCKLANEDGNVQHSCRRFPTKFSLICKNTLLRHIFPRTVDRYLMKDYDHKRARKVDWVSGALMLVRKDALEKAGLFDESFFMYSEDVDLCRRIGKHFDVAYSPDTEAVHLGGYASKQNLSLFLIHLKSALHYFRKERDGLYD